MELLFESKEHEIQDFIYNAIDNKILFFLSIDSDEINFCMDCCVTGLLNERDSLSIFFTKTDSEMEEYVSLKKSEIKKVNIRENGISFVFKNIVVELFYLSDEYI